MSGKDSGPSTMDRMGQIFSGMVMNEAMKDKEQQYEDEMNRIANQQNHNLEPKEEMKEDEYGGNEKVRKDSLDSDEDFNLDEDAGGILDALKAKRLREMKKDAKKIIENKAKGHGQYTEISQDEFLPTVTGTKHVVCHFYHRDFERCKIIDMHLRQIAKDHLETRFVCIDAEKAPFFITKLAIKVLPTIILFDDGVAIDRVVGFEDLGGEDEFETIVLTRRLVKGKAIKPLNKAEAGRINIKKGKKQDSDSDDDDY